MEKRSTDIGKLTETEIVVTCLKEQGVDAISGYPGGAILNIYDTLYQHRDEIAHILTSHEQGAPHAADGYARITGKVGVRLATSSPGATSLVTGIAITYMDSVPVVVITCNVTNSLLGEDDFQEIDITDVAMPITKYNFIVKDVNHLATVIHRAFTIAQTGRPGPVLVDITKDVTAALCECGKQIPEEAVRQSDAITGQDMNRTVEMTRKAAKPSIFVGDGVVLSNASDKLRTFARKIQAPVADSLMGKGAFDGVDELYAGTVGMHGAKASNFNITKADLLIVMGARFGDCVAGDTPKFAKNVKILQLDIDPAEINKNIKVDTSIIGDVKVVLHKFNARLNPVSHDGWTARIERMKDMYPLRYDKSMLTGPFIVQTTNEVTSGDVVTVVEVGQHQIWAAQYYQYRQPRTLLTSGGLGTIGYGLGAAIGAKVGCRDRTAINIAGDGCFRMNTNEIATATRYSVPVVKVIVNNHVLGMIRQWQTLLYGKHYSQTILNDSVDFVRIAEAMGTKAHRVTQKKELEPVLHETISLNIPVVIDCQISCDDKVFPMVLPGTPVVDAFDDTDLKIN